MIYQYSNGLGIFNPSLPYQDEMNSYQFQQSFKSSDGQINQINDRSLTNSFISNEQSTSMNTPIEFTPQFSIQALPIQSCPTNQMAFEVNNRSMPNMTQEEFAFLQQKRCENEQQQRLLQQQQLSVQQQALQQQQMIYQQQLAVLQPVLLQPVLLQPVLLNRQLSMQAQAPQPSLNKLLCEEDPIVPKTVSISKKKEHTMNATPMDGETPSSVSSCATNSFVSSPLVIGSNLVSPSYVSHSYVTPVTNFSPFSPFSPDSRVPLNPATPSVNKFSIPTPQTDPLYSTAEFNPAKSGLDELPEVEISRFSTESLTPEDLSFSEQCDSKLEDILNDDSLNDYCKTNFSEQEVTENKTTPPKTGKIIKQKSAYNLQTSSTKKNRPKLQKSFSLEECSRTFQTLNTINIIQENFSEKKVLKSKSMKNLKSSGTDKKTAFGKYALNT